MIKEQIIDKLNNLAIVDVVSDYVELKKSGVNYKGRCPFHNDKNPSFVVSPAKNICHCFVCGKGGNPIHFIMEHEKVDFPEACRILGKKYNIEVEEEKRERTPAEIEEQRKKEAMAIIYAHVQRFFVDCLHNRSPEAMAMMDYARNR